MSNFGKRLAKFLWIILFSDVFLSSEAPLTLCRSCSAERLIDANGIRLQASQPSRLPNFHAKLTRRLSDLAFGKSSPPRKSPLLPYLLCALTRGGRTRRQMLSLVAVSVETSFTNL